MWTSEFERPDSAESSVKKPLIEQLANKRRQSSFSVVADPATDPAGSDPTDGEVVDVTKIDPRAVDSMLANQMQNLSFQDRTAVIEVSR